MTVCPKCRKEVYGRITNEFGRPMSNRCLPCWLDSHKIAKMKKDLQELKYLEDANELLKAIQKRIDELNELYKEVS